MSVFQVTRVRTNRDGTVTVDYHGTLPLDGIACFACGKTPPDQPVMGWFYDGEGIGKPMALDIPSELARIRVFCLEHAPETQASAR